MVIGAHGHPQFRRGLLPRPAVGTVPSLKALAEGTGVGFPGHCSGPRSGREKLTSVQ